MLRLGKFVHTPNGRLLMSVLLGLGAATLFREVCKDKRCRRWVAGSLEQVKERWVRKDAHTCVQYVPVGVSCASRAAGDRVVWME